MKKILGPILVIVGLLVVAALVLIPSYNKFVTLEENINESYAQVENQLQRRLDLIPNLVETVKGFASHEKEVISDISNARAKLAGAQGPDEQSAANGELESALGRLLVVVENYPDLKANENFIQLMDSLEGTENRIGVARQDYNTEVGKYNKQVKRFPGKLTASIFGFEEKEYFQADAAASDAPKVDFGNDKD
ncbi:LemA family protein [Sporosarcina siberiensis]|uniref:LemA family protein n=1 Tax=Sporosarcina siberiensis TaxID=1365606 RepID=A0ABW4SDQ9_9BACL